MKVWSLKRIIFNTNSNCLRFSLLGMSTVLYIKCFKSVLHLFSSHQFCTLWKECSHIWTIRWERLCIEIKLWNFDVGRLPLPRAQTFYSPLPVDLTDSSPDFHSLCQAQIRMYLVQSSRVFRWATALAYFDLMTLTHKQIPVLYNFLY